MTLTPILMIKIKYFTNQQNHETDVYDSGTKKEFTTSVGHSNFTLDCEAGSDGGKPGKCTSSIIINWGVTGCAILGTENTNCGNTVAW